MELAKCRMPKATCFLSCVENRPNKNIRNINEKQVTLRGGHIQEREGIRGKLRR
jgi:hypothetical protein